MGKFLNRLQQTWRDMPAQQKAVGAVAACAVLGLIFAFWPHRVDEVVRFDGGGEWRRESAPPRRLIVWKPAERLPLPDAPSPAGKEFITPTFTDGGGTLYFSRRTAGKPAEIARSHFRHGQWEQPQAVKELNGPADDMGPILSPDGRELYFYSNRAGGRGGFDLYVSTWLGNQWSSPKNLGPTINTPANEYDPCLDPAGTKLYFASNRTPRMARRASEERAEDQPEWSGSLRAETGQRTYDLYRAHRDGDRAAWSEVAAVAELNTPDSNEGAPTISPDGAFLYFASDRPARRGEELNLDLYRARLVRGEITGRAENLGPGINTSAHETEPALSPEGFRLVFASNREGADDLYVSTTAEVYETSTRDASRLRALANPWLWAGLFCAALLLWASWLMYSHRGKLAEKIWPARFLAASVVINLCFIFLLFLWKLPGLMEAIVKQFQEPIPASRVVDEQALQSQQSRETLYGKVADLPPVESAPIDWPNEELPAVSPAAPETPPVLPEDNRLPLSHAIPAHVPQTIVAVRTPQAAPAPDPKPLMRNQPRSAIPSPPVESLAELPVMKSQPLEEIPSETPLEKQQTAQVDSQIPATADPSPPRDFRPQSAPLSARPKAPQVAFATPVPRQVERQSPKAPEPKQIASIDDSALKPIQKPDEEQIPPAESAKLEHQPPMVAMTLKLPDEAPPKTSETILKNQPIAIEWKPLVPEPRSSRQTPSPAELKKPSAPTQLAKVAELDVPPELNLPSPSMPAETAPPQETQPALPRQTGIAGISEPPTPTPSENTPQTLAKADSTLKLPRQLEPKLSRTMLKPAASVARNSQPVEVHEAAELSLMLSLRNPDTRREMASVFGHHPAEEAAVKRGLLWLAMHQNEDGSWSLNEFHKNCEKHAGKCSGTGSERSNAAATGLALLPFLAAGHVPESKEYGQVVAKALAWLIENQHEDGKLQAPGDNQVMYSHGIATIALCEAYAMTQEPRLGEAAKKAVDFIVKGQHQPTGGWRYNPNEPGDTSVVGWQVMALKSAEMAGIAVPAATYEKVRHWLASVEGNRPVGGVFGYMNQSPTPAMTAEGLLCLEFLSEPRTSPRLQAGGDYLIRHLPQPDQRHTSYYWYYATQVLYHLQDDRWTTWNDSLRKLLLDGQQKNGPANGTWEPKDHWEKRGGRIYTTAIKLLMLEIDYRHLPLYGGLQPIVQP